MNRATRVCTVFTILWAVAFAVAYGVTLARAGSSLTPPGEAPQQQVISRTSMHEGMTIVLNTLKQRQPTPSAQERWETIMNPQIDETLEIIRSATKRQDYEVVNKALKVLGGLDARLFAAEVVSIALDGHLDWQRLYPFVP